MEDRGHIFLLWVFSGVASLIVALTTIAACWILNPWFNFWRDAFSDFGTARACCPWLYNWGLISSAVFLLAFSLFVCKVSSNRIEAFSSGLFFTSSIFLALIGIFPGGTRPHTFVSTWFFVQVFMAFAALGIGLFLEGDRARGILVSCLSGSAPFLGLLIDVVHGWPSAAVAEATGIVIIGISLITVTSYYLMVLRDE